VERSRPLNFHSAHLCLACFFVTAIISLSLSGPLLSAVHGQLLDNNTLPDDMALDDIGPDIFVPQSVPIEATSLDGAEITYTVTAEDNVDGTATLEEDGIITQDNVGGDITISCSPASGSMFPVGDTIVQCTATDAAGNEGRASFTVAVNAPPGSNARAVPSDTEDNSFQAQPDQVAGTLLEPIADMFPLIVLAAIVVIGGTALGKYSKNRNRGRRLRIPPSAVVDIHTKGGTRE
jgi:HYR domain-containing protein